MYYIWLDKILLYTTEDKEEAETLYKALLKGGMKDDRIKFEKK